MSYFRCICQKCGSNFATLIGSDAELGKEKCPSCGEKKLKMAGALSAHELNSQFGGGGG